MTVVLADLVAKIRAEGVQEAAAQVRAVGAEATQTARALEIMAAQFSKMHGGTAAEALSMFQRTGAQPTAAAMAQAAAAAEKTTAAIRAAVPHTQTAARAAQDVAEGWKLSESNIVRAGAGILGIGLGISLAAGAARLVHDAVVSIKDAQLDWERSLKNISGLYGEAGARAAALATAQANLPGVLGDQQEFAQAAINASALTLRYGLPQRVVDQLTTTGGRMAFAMGMTDEASRAQLQAQLLAAVETGANLPARYGLYTDPESVARRLGGAGAASLQAYTPAQIMETRAAILSGGGNQFADRANLNQRFALDAATAAEKAMEQARSNLQNNLENAQAPSSVPAAGPEIQGFFPGGAGDPATFRGRGPISADDAARNAEARLVQDIQQVTAAAQLEAQALSDSAKAQEAAAQVFVRLSQTVEAAGARLLSFFGSLENPVSIARGDILAQAQGAVTARARSAIPVMGMGAAEIGAIARGTAAQQAWQNYVAPLAQQEETNVIERNLRRLAAPSPNSPDRQNSALQSAAQQALLQMPRLAQINALTGGAATRAAQIDFASADTQARLEAISLTQRERYVQLMRETVDLRRLDIQHQQEGVALTMAVIRAQQAASPAQAVASAAQYEQNLAQALSRQRQARLLQGQDVSGLPTVDQLIQLSFGGQLAEAENAPSLVRGARGIEVASQAATAAGLAQSLTAGQIRSAELANDLKNLEDLPAQTALMLEDVQNGRASLSVQQELREYMKQLVWIMQNQPGVAGAGGAAPPAPSDLPGARHQ